MHPQNLGLVRSPFGNAETLIRNRTHCEKVCHTRKSLIGHFLWNAKNFDFAFSERAFPEKVLNWKVVEEKGDHSGVRREEKASDEKVGIGET